jgi:tetratricopeptide (TPR) repeat protein
MPAAVRRVLLLAILVLLVAPPALRVSLHAQPRELPAPEAWAALKGGNAAKAASLFRETLERDPYNPLLHFGAGYAAFALGRHDAAISALKKALEYDPKFGPAAVLLAQVAYASNDLDLAIRSMEKARALAPDEPYITQQLEAWKKEAEVHGELAERPGVRFRVLFEGTTQQALGDRVAEVLESAYWRVGNTLNNYPSETLTVLLYTNKQFQDITRAPAWASGRYDGRIRLAVGGAMRVPHVLERVVIHELVHAVIAHIAPRNVPAWVHEGMASVLESDDRTWVQDALAHAHEIFPLDDLANGFSGLDGQQALVAYAESAVAADLLRERLGLSLGSFLQMLGSGHSVDQALSAFNVQPEAFHAEWRRRVGAQ